MFKKLCCEKLFAKCKKCFFGQTSMKYLGHIVEAGNLHMDPDKVEAIHTLQKSTVVKEL